MIENMPAILFYAFATLAVVSGFGVILNMRNTVYSALSLVVSMIAIAVLFVLLQAQFIGVIQIMIYAGAIVVLFLFVIMLLNLKGGDLGAERQPILKTLGAVVLIAATAKLWGFLSSVRREWSVVDEEFGTVRWVGEAMFTDYILAVELAGVLLLAGIVGAVVLGKHRIEE